MSKYQLSLSEYADGLKRRNPEKSGSKEQRSELLLVPHSSASHASMDVQQVSGMSLNVGLRLFSVPHSSVVSMDIQLQQVMS